MPQSSMNFTRRSTTKNAKIYRRKACEFDSLTANCKEAEPTTEFDRLNEIVE